MNSQHAFIILQQIRELYGQINQCFAHSAPELPNEQVATLTPQQLLIVKLIGHQGRVTISSLCQQMSLSKGTVSGIVSRMVTMGILEKHHDTEDRRTIWIQFSPSGQELAVHFRSHMASVLSALVQDFSPQEQEQLTTDLNRLIQSIKEKKESNTCQQF